LPFVVSGLKMVEELVKPKPNAQEMLEIGNSFNFKSLKFND